MRGLNGGAARPDHEIVEGDLIRRLTLALAFLTASGGSPDGGADPTLPRRLAMVEDQLAREGIVDARVLQAMRDVPRHLFVPEEHRARAYEPYPLPIGEGQTISQPYVVGFMTEILRLGPGHKVLEVGTGSGYQAAVAARIAREVYTVEIFESLAESARERLARLGTRNVHVRQGDGYHGWKEEAPFDAIIVTCAGGHLPPPLIEQLKPGGRMVMPVGGPFMTQNLVLVEKDLQGRVSQRNVLPVMFVRLLGH